MNKFVDYVNKQNEDDLIQTILKKKEKNPLEILNQIQQSRTEYGLKVQRILEKGLIAALPAMIGQTWKVSHEGHPVLIQGQTHVLTGVQGGQLLFDQQIKLDIETVLKYMQIF